MAYIVTRIDVGDYERWKPMFDQDGPGARTKAIEHRVLRGADKDSEVVILIEFATTGDAREARERLISSGVLDRFEDKTLPTVYELAEQVAHG